jgi:glycosyltransferase involved in cell wall biosynthesis
MKIAIVGTRGVPARYGGFETLADQLSRRLVARGHEVTVYCRRPFTRPDDVFDHRIRRVILPTISHKHFDTFFHTLISILHVVGTSAEVILICNVANGPFAWLPRLFGKPTALNVDGLDRKRRKWNVIARSFLYVCEVFSSFAPTQIITDARAVQDYYKKRYGTTSEMIGYGAQPLTENDFFKRIGLASRKYFLYVARLEPENNPELVLRAYRSIRTDWPLVVVGGNPYNPEYVNKLKTLSAKQVIFTGPVYGQDYWSLQRNAGVFIFGGEIGGIHPALVEAMAAGNAVLYLDTPENRETTSGCGIYFQHEQADLTHKLQQLLGCPEDMERMRAEACSRAREIYNWEKITDQYESLLKKIL